MGNIQITKVSSILLSAGLVPSFVLGSKVRLTYLPDMVNNSHFISKNDNGALPFSVDSFIEPSTADTMSMIRLGLLYVSANPDLVDRVTEQKVFNAVRYMLMLKVTVALDKFIGVQTQDVVFNGTPDEENSYSSMSILCGIPDSAMHVSNNAVDISNILVPLYNKDGVKTGSFLFNYRGSVPDILSSSVATSELKDSGYVSGVVNRRIMSLVAQKQITFM